MFSIRKSRLVAFRTGSVAVAALLAYTVLLSIAAIVWMLVSNNGHVRGGVELMALQVERDHTAATMTIDAAMEEARYTEVIDHDNMAAAAPHEITQHIEEDDSQTFTLNFNGRPLRKSREMTMLVTAYSPDSRSCGKFADGITASGYSVWTNGMKLVAADTDLLPFGTVITVPGYNDGQPVPVLDRGGKIKGNRLDLLHPTHEIARQWGAQRLTVTVWEYAD